MTTDTQATERMYTPVPRDEFEHLLNVAAIARQVLNAYRRDDQAALNRHLAALDRELPAEGKT